jgi:ubiquinone/menaquinone biosynthesis C-methylase UbiE
MKPDDPAYAGQKHYTPWFLKIYDPLVLGFFATAVWRCPARRLVEHYNQHVGRRHLDVGPGTGYFLEHARLPAGASLTLVDPNPNVLAHASRRLAHLDVSVIEADVCKPLVDRVDNRLFDSVALNLVLHCLPGPVSRKATAIAHLAAVLEPDGVLFGATVLGTPELHTPLSRLPLLAYNRLGAFDNLSDSEQGLREILSESFEAIELDNVGSVAIFTATRPRHLAS